MSRAVERIPLPASSPGTVRLVTAEEQRSTPVAGLVVYAGALGGKIDRGDLVAEIVDPTAGDPAAARTAPHAGMAGHVISRRLQRIVGPGDFVAMIVAPA